MRFSEQQQRGELRINIAVPGCRTRAVEGHRGRGRVMTLHPSWSLLVPSDQSGRDVGPRGRVCLHRSGNSSLESTGCAHPLNTYSLCSCCMQGTGLGPGETLIGRIVACANCQCRKGHRNSNHAGRTQAPEESHEPHAPFLTPAPTCCCLDFSLSHFLILTLCPARCSHLGLWFGGSEST